MNLIGFIYFVAALLPASSAQAPGWRMVDRFYGFRYELRGQGVLNSGIEEAIQKKADELGCFGWVQRSFRDSLVGEARCSKARGPTFQSWLGAGAGRDSNSGSGGKIETEFKVYEDTKIRLHFAYFKIVEDDRDTCFLDAPHKCPDEAQSFSTTDRGNTRTSFASDEL
jgi:hypothetical protein